MAKQANPRAKTAQHKIAESKELASPNASVIEQAKSVLEEIKKRKVLPDGSIEINLPSGKVARIMDFRGHHIQKARAMMDHTKGKEETFMYSLIALTTTIDGQGITMENLLFDMKGFDVMVLEAEFESSNF